ncbi:DUF1206 domain-containing protein [Nocardioides sp. BP30]|uniref:DUF1206 domain-containing protein n=1 Tax=Nocardioides sp. BP30 TaxID=3036374 RepID=UPI00246865C6|nr:DUF1206 domain-containing protein [Nocardioides sp. BP30]WGL51371.1 DUF1206 domain-containing protein [Nocardioides sp. BP30]
MSVHRADAVAAQARDHPVMEWGARMGFAVYGLVYVVLAWLAVQVAVAGGRSASVSRQGALREVARQPLGHTVLWIAFVGFCALVLWEVATALGGHEDKDGADRVRSGLGSAAKAIVFAAFAISTAKIALGAGSSSHTKGWTARLMSLPGGPVIVGAIGVAVAGYGCYSIAKGLGDGWRKELDARGTRGDLGRVITVLARAGYTSRGVAFGIIGGLFVWAAITEDPNRSGGLDRALQRLRGAPFGTALLVLVALGFACYGVYNVAKARHLRPR